MLLEFRVRNYKSIRNEQILSLVASADSELVDTHVASTGLKSAPKAVRSAVIYGPNASGKSTLLFALHYMRSVVAESASVVQPGQTYNVQPFKLNEQTVNEPTDFEIAFVMEGVRHQYAFTMTSQRIVSESLLVYRTSKPTQLFSRRLLADGEGYEYEFSSYLTGSRKLWQESTRPNALFLSTAAQLNSERLSPVFRWIVDSIIYLPSRALLNDGLTTEMLATSEGRETVRRFLGDADISIADVQAVPRKGFRNQVVFSAGDMPKATREEAEFLVPMFLHASKTGEAKFELNDESDGTQRLYGLTAPFLDALRDGKILVVDELDSSLHTLLVRRLVSMFHDSTTNRANAQLLFSTHDTSLLDRSLFRRDQVWFTEKDEDQATCLYPLSDFSPRKQEAWERGYLMGRYGAVPYFGGDSRPSQNHVDRPAGYSRSPMPSDPE
jgi:AAA15 family ATPase/GTPase